ncbi:hypothetical protein [Methanothrix sp.]|uniref:hypothetical protein n=1 Tax=Methanothrix sp. TaxID=90426 RepID=UPI003742D074
MSEKLFSLYFAFNALGMIGGPMLYLRLSKRFRRHSIIIAGFISTFLGGLLVYHLGSLQPWIFALCLFPATIMGSRIRTPGANLMLEQQEEDTGSASALMSCFGILMGSIGMTVISQEWSNTIRILGLMNILVGVLCLGLWLLLSKRPFVKLIP